MHLFLYILISIYGIGASQTNSIWDILTKVESRQTYNPDIGYINVDIKVSEEVMKLNGTQIEVEGYIIPLTGEVGQNNFMYSMYPKSMCFFCGGAGPESAMEVWMEGDDRLPYTSKRIVLKGKLEVDKDDATGLIYTLSEATRIQ